MQAEFAPRWAANGIAHFDIAGPQLDALRDFYGALFGWTITSRGPGYSAVETPPGSANGALLESEAASLTIGIVVRELDRCVEIAVERGGAVVMPPTDNGYVRKAQVADPAGNRITLIAG